MTWCNCFLEILIFSVVNESYGVASLSKTLKIMLMLPVKFRFAEVFSNEKARRLLQPVKNLVFEIRVFFTATFVNKATELNCK